MAKYCGNCGAPLDDDARVCGQCGTPVAEYSGRTQEFKYVDPKKREKSKKRFKLIGIVVLILIIVIVAVNVISNFTGRKGFVRKVMNAYRDYDIETLISLSSDMYYYGYDDAAETYFESAVGYGLDSFEMKPLAALREAEARRTPARFPGMEISPARRTGRGRRMWKPNRAYLSNAAAAIAAIILFFTFSIPVENTEVIRGNYAQLLPTEMFEQMKKQSLVLTPVSTPQSGKRQAAKDVKPAAVREVKVKAKESRPQSSAETPQPQKQTEAKALVKKTYHIIVASMATEKEAQRMAGRLKKEGYQGASAIIGDGKKRVSIESFATRAEAYQSLQVIREQEAYRSAWILKY